MSSDPTSEVRTIWRRLGDTHLFRWAGFYGTGALMGLTLVEFAREPWGLAPALVQTIQLLLGAGMAVTLILAWFHGEKGRQRVSPLEVTLLGLAVVVTAFATERVWQGAGAGGVVVTELSAQPISLADPSEFGIAVLLFEHLGPESFRDQTDAIHGEVTDGLERVSGFTVLDRSTVLALDDPTAPAREVAAVLGVRYLFTGRLQWTEGQFRLTVQLVDGLSGIQSGSWVVPARYDATDEVFAVQASVAGHVARVLRVEILPGEQADLTNVPTADALAMDAYLLGMADLSVLGLDVEAMRRALGHLERAVERDPAYGEAWARLAYLRQLALTQHRRGFPDVTPESVEHALVQAESHAVSAFETELARATHSYWADGDWELAERQLVRLVKRSPSAAEVHWILGLLLRRTGDWARAMAELDAAMTLAPLGYSTLIFASEAHHMIGGYARAIELTEKAQEVDPSLPWALWNQARTHLWGLGDTTAALGVFERSPHSAVDAWMSAVLQVRGDHAESLRDARRTGRPLDWQLVVLYRDAGFSDSARVYGAQYRNRRLTRLGECPPPEVRTLCRQNVNSELAVTMAVVGDTAAALGYLEDAEYAHDLYHDAYHSTSSLGIRSLAYTELGMWEEATETLRELLSAPSFLQPGVLRTGPGWAPLRENYPPFLELLSETEARGPLF